MSNNFDLAHNFTAKWEGGTSEHPNDAGGLTKFGASIKFVSDLASTSQGRAFLQSLGLTPLPVCRATILNLTQDQARAMFCREFWQKPGLDALPSPTAILIYDAAVNCGLSRSVKFAQKGANQVLNTNLAVDGILGPKTKKALSTSTQPLIKTILNNRRQFYHSLASKKPSQQVFLQGWLNRVNALEACIFKSCK